MANNLRDLRRKMKAFKSTKQVTKAMELVSASKMRKAVQNAQTLRRYAYTAWSLLQNVARVHPGLHPMLEERPLKNVLVLFFTSDRALCGSFNSHLFKAAMQQVKAIQGISADATVEFVAVGTKGQQFLARTGNKVAAAFPALSNNPAFRSILPISRLAIDGFLNKTYDRVILLYSDFVSALVQEPTAKVLLPFSEKELRAMTESMGEGQHRKHHHEESETGDTVHLREYKFEPSANEVLDRILPQLTELQIYQAALENAASEHSARMIAMRNASDNASELISDLTLTYNQTRQGIITAELAELSASKAALD